MNWRQQDQGRAREERPAKLGHVMDPNRPTPRFLRNNQPARPCDGAKPRIGAPAVQEQ
jgi:hypothetical protein